MIPLPWTGILPASLDAQSLVHSAPELLQGWGSHSFPVFGVGRTALLSLACFQQMDVPIVEVGDQWIRRLRS